MSALADSINVFAVVVLSTGKPPKCCVMVVAVVGMDSN